MRGFIFEVHGEEVCQAQWKDSLMPLDLLFKLLVLVWLDSGYYKIVRMWKERIFEAETSVAS